MQSCEITLSWWLVLKWFFSTPRGLASFIPQRNNDDVSDSRQCRSWADWHLLREKVSPPTLHDSEWVIFFSLVTLTHCNCNPWEPVKSLWEVKYLAYLNKSGIYSLCSSLLTVWKYAVPLVASIEHPVFESRMHFCARCNKQPYTNIIIHFKMYC